jgi:hypothetical protein
MEHRLGDQRIMLNQALASPVAGGMARLCLRIGGESPAIAPIAGAEARCRLGVAPVAVVPGKYALFRTAQLNFSINEQPQRAGELRHLGFEDDAAPPGFAVERDVNGIDWELFSPKTQDEKIVEVYGTPVKA